MASNFVSIGVSEDLYRQLAGTPSNETPTQTQERVLCQIRECLQSFIQWAQADRAQAIAAFLQHQSPEKPQRKTVHIPKDLHRQLMAERTVWKEQRQRVTLFALVNFAIVQFGVAKPAPGAETSET